MENKVVLFDIDYTLFDTGRYKQSNLTQFIIYDEVVSVLTEVASSATVGIFSEGEKDHQLRKLLTTKIKDHFHDNHLHVFSKKLEALASVLEKYQGKKLYFVDDKLEVLQGIKESDPDITVIWIQRGAYAEAVNAIAGFTPDLTVTTLSDIVPFIKK